MKSDEEPINVVNTNNLLSSSLIKKLAEDKDLIKPFIPYKASSHNIKGGDCPVVSYGLGEHSYDVRLDKVYRISSEHILDVKNPDDYQLIPIDEVKNGGNGDYIIVEAGGFVLGTTVETFNIPQYITGVLYCKSSYARVGMNMAPTVLKSGWRGQLVLEIHNQSNHPIKLYLNEGIGSIYFHMHSDESLVLYSNSASEHAYTGNYQSQTGLTKANVK